MSQQINSMHSHMRQSVHAGLNSLMLHGAASSSVDVPALRSLSECNGFTSSTTSNVTQGPIKLATSDLTWQNQTYVDGLYSTSGCHTEEFILIVDCDQLSFLGMHSKVTRIVLDEFKGRDTQDGLDEGRMHSTAAFRSYAVAEEHYRTVLD